MPFTDPFRPQDQIDQVRKVGRLAQLLLEMRSEYERKPRRALLDQIIARIDELSTLRAEMGKALEAGEAAASAHIPHE